MKPRYEVRQAYIGGRQPTYASPQLEDVLLEVERDGMELVAVLPIPTNGDEVKVVVKRAPAYEPWATEDWDVAIAKMREGFTLTSVTTEDYVDRDNNAKTCVTYYLQRPVPSPSGE